METFLVGSSTSHDLKLAIIYLKKSPSDSYIAGPNNTLEYPPQYCPPTRECQITRLQTLFNTCSGPQGTYEPLPCAPGFYCPDGGTEQLPCPAGHYCPLGSFAPWRCNSVSACHSSSSRQFPLVGIMILVIIDVLLLISAAGPILRRLWHSWRKSKPLPLLQDPELQHESASIDASQKTEKAQMMSDEKSFHLSQFVKSLQRCIGLSNIGLEIGFNNLGLQMGADGKTILNGVSGTVKPGCLLAVMGASGAGKCWCIFLSVEKLQ